MTFAASDGASIPRTGADGHRHPVAHWLHGYLVAHLTITRLGVVLLTNAVHPYRRIAQQTEMRAAVHRRVSEPLLDARRKPTGLGALDTEAVRPSSPSSTYWTS